MSCPLSAFFYTVTTYLFIRNHYSLKEAMKNIVRLLVLHAMMAGIICQLLQFQLPSVFDDFFEMLRGAYVVLGMMIIGLVLGRQSRRGEGFVFEWRLILMSNVVRFTVYPLMAMLVITFDRQAFQFFSPLAQQIILLVSLMPMGADTTSLAAQWNSYPERIAALTLVNSLVALFIIPFALPILLRF